eukprot:SAG31_NODE_31722_length_365_cov_0.582707_1_plen_66_part_01
MVSFVQPSPTSAAWLWNVSYMETQAGDYYIDVFFRDDEEIDYDLAQRVSGNRLFIKVLPTVAAGPT